MISNYNRIKSKYAPVINFNPMAYNFIFNYYIEPKINLFFKFHQIKNINKLDSDFIISNKDFKMIEFNYFYKHLLFDISRINDKVKIVPKYGITFDPECTDLTCEKTGMKYGIIYLYNIPLFYYLYFDLNELIDFINCNKKQYEQYLKLSK